MSDNTDTPSTPSIVIDLDRLERNITRMQGACDRHGVELWPHIKTHKMVEVARRQLAAGAAGLTCAKLSEAEAMLPSGVKRIFVAHSLVGKEKAPRVQRLAEQLDTLVLACTSERHFEALDELIAATGLRLPVMLAADSGLGREGFRDFDSGFALAKRIATSTHMELLGLYTHEGHAYSLKPEEVDGFVADLHERMTKLRDDIDSELQLWPGCSVTAERMAALPGIQAVRPGAYVFGDLSQAVTTKVIRWEDVALTVHAQVVDRPCDGLALIDAGSKVFSSDKTAAGITALAADGRDLAVTRCNEEHGYLTGKDVDTVTISETISFIPAHVCPVVNLTDTVNITRGNEVIDQWRVDARGRVT